ncbi:5'-hydroxyaverantin dehydrogenase [Cyphellophora attinorum]|uniref:5'-hydroxyaverantin dehydrogenase n=1 Tax=Cyphellophora attinorum TaxID=1664694 RepID=A0A0N1H018_9EURO|nr:5'-hydroxyaverantin dehydrogenase [Phialophora attinorum]KPI36884.1 5'-hydroxyaverantin dehydrogenase [Phialophora attinorum]
MDSPPAVQPYQNPPISAPVNTASPIPFESLRSRTVLITGGASGIGASIASTVAQHGGNVIIGDLNDQLGEGLIADLRQISESARHHFIHLDVTSWQSQVAFFKQAAALSPHGGIDTVVANAGIASAEEIAFVDPPDYANLDDPPPPKHQIMNVNLMGVLYTTELALSYLSRNPGSNRCNDSHSGSGARDRHLLLVSSIAGVVALPSQALYCVSKHAVVGLFRTLRITAPGNNGVRVNMLNPYFTATPIMGSIGPLFMSGAAMAQIEDVAGAAVRMVADKNIVGRALIVISRGSRKEVEGAGLEYIEGDQHGNAVRDMLPDDMIQTDAFVRRMIAVINLRNAGRGWLEFFQDAVRGLVMLARRITGR